MSFSDRKGGSTLDGNRAQVTVAVFGMTQKLKFFMSKYFSHDFKLSMVEIATATSVWLPSNVEARSTLRKFVIGRSLLSILRNLWMWITALTFNVEFSRALLKSKLLYYVMTSSDKRHDSFKTSGMFLKICNSFIQCGPSMTQDAQILAFPRVICRAVQF